VDLTCFAEVVELRSAEWASLGINQSLHYADGRETGPAATLFLDNDVAAGQLTVFQSGVVVTIVVYNPDSAVRIVHCEAVDNALPACLDELTELFLHRPPDELLQAIDEL
jgi:hypothetical protein